MKIINKSMLIAGLISLSISSVSAQSSHNNIYVDVEKSEPIYKTIKVRVPYEEVISKAYTVRVPCGGSYVQKDKNSIGLDTVVGMGLGVALGNQIGHGNGQIAAKVVGGLLGAKIANSSRNSSYQTQYCNETRYKDEIVTRYDYTTQNKLQGYKNSFIYDGKTYIKMSDHPLKKVRVRTTLSY